MHSEKDKVKVSQYENGVYFERSLKQQWEKCIVATIGDSKFLLILEACC